MRLSAALMRRIATQHGIVTAPQLIADGCSVDAIRRAVTRRFLVRLHRRTYRVGTAPDTFESRCVAACLAEPHAVITGRAAGRIWSFPHLGRVDRVVVALPHDRTTLGRDLLLRRTNVLPDDEIVRRADGIALTSPPRSWFECARDLDDDGFEALTEHLLDHHTSLPTLWHTIRRLDTRGRPGLGRAKRVMSQRAAWQRPADSRLELRVLRALERRGVGPLVRQHPIRLPSGHVIHLDGACPELRWGIEVDHVTWHGGRAQAQRDKTRDRQLRRLRWQIERVTDQELRDDFDSVIDEIAVLHGTRSTEVGS